MNNDRNQPKNPNFNNPTSKDRNQDRNQHRPTGGTKDFDQSKQKGDFNKPKTGGTEGR